jgi:hypothetical protein
MFMLIGLKKPLASEKFPSPKCSLLTPSSYVDSRADTASDLALRSKHTPKPSRAAMLIYSAEQLRPGGGGQFPPWAAHRESRQYFSDSSVLDARQRRREWHGRSRETQNPRRPMTRNGWCALAMMLVMAAVLATWDTGRSNQQFATPN